MIYNDRYLKLELYNGNYYNEEPKPREEVDQFYRTKFDRMDMVFNLSSFDLKRTKKELFQNNRQMKNIAELTEDIDSLKNSVSEAKYGFFRSARGFFAYHMDSVNIEVKGYHDREKPGDTTRKSPVEASMFGFFQLDGDQDQKMGDSIKPKSDKSLPFVKADSATIKAFRNKLAQDQSAKKVVKDDGRVKSALVDTLSWAFLNNKSRNVDLIQTAKNQAQNVKVNLSSVSSRVGNLQRDVNKFIIEKWKKYSQAFACIVMFLIGAPLGAIIKKGGLGVPVIVSILFFLTYYIINIICEKSAREGIIDPAFAVWIADLSLLPIGLFFLRQARIDARLFDTDFYNVWIDKMKTRFGKSN